MTDVVGDPIELRRRLDEARAKGKRVGLVPTMGALHAGHRSLIDRAVTDCDVVAVTVFVNPLQFAPDEDLDAYPRTLDDDVALASAAGAAVVFAPDDAAMYPEPIRTVVHVEELSVGLEGASRPTHFDGVTTVVAKLFQIAGPCRGYFGEKDFQQLALVRRMVADLSMPVEVVGCPIVREPDGLALSSRNRYLSPDERAAATVLSQALAVGAAAVGNGERDPDDVEAAVAAVIAAEPRAALDYAAVRRPDTLQRPEIIDEPVRLLVAATVGTTRLIDNLAAAPPLPPG